MSASSVTLTNFTGSDSQALLHPNSQSVKCSFPRVLTNILSPVSLIAASIFLSYESNKAKPDPRILTACYLDIGICARALLQANLPDRAMRAIHNGLARWSLELYEILWNTYLNVQDPQVQAALLNVITALGGFQTAGDVITAATLKKGSQPERSLAELDLDAETTNRLLCPAYNNKKWQVTIGVMAAALGAGLTVFGYVQDSSLQTLCISAGLYLVSHTAGFFSMEQMIKALKQLERTETVIDLDAVRGSNVSCGKKTLRNIVKVIPHLSVIATTLAGLTIIMKPAALPALCVPSGILAGATNYHAQRDFQILTPTIYEARQRGNYREPSNAANASPAIATALKVDFALSGVWVALFLGFFIYGLTVSPVREQGEITSLITSMITFLALGVFSELFFKPNREGLCFNTLYYGLHNVTPWAMIYFILNQITAIDDTSLKLASPIKHAVGVVNLVVYGMILACNRIRYTSLTRADPAFTPALYQIQWVKTAVLRFLGDL